MLHDGTCGSSIQLRLFTVTVSTVASEGREGIEWVSVCVREGEGVLRPIHVLSVAHVRSAARSLARLHAHTAVRIRA